MNKSELNKSEAVNIFDLKFVDAVKQEINRCIESLQDLIDNGWHSPISDKPSIYTFDELIRIKGKLEGVKLIKGKIEDLERGREPEIIEPFSPEKLGFKEYESNKDYWHPSWFKNETRKTPDGKPYEDIHKWQIRKLINHDNRYLIKHYKDVKGAVYPEVVFTEFNIGSHQDGVVILRSLGVIK